MSADELLQNSPVRQENRSPLDQPYTVPLDDNAFAEAVLEFENVLDDLKGDRCLDKFRTEYDRLYRAFIKSHEGEKRLMKKCRELNSEIVANSAKVYCVRSLEDEALIEGLKKEIDLSWKEVEAAHGKETGVAEDINKEMKEISQLHKTIDQGRGPTTEHQDNITELWKVKEDLLKDRDEQTVEVFQLRDQLIQADLKQDDINEKIECVCTSTQNLVYEIKDKRDEISRELHRRDTLQQGGVVSREEVNKRLNELKLLSDQYERYQTDYNKFEIIVKDQKAVVDKIAFECEQVDVKVKELENDYQQQLINCDHVTSDNLQKTAEIRQREDDLFQIKTDAQRISKLLEAARRRVRGLEDQKFDIDTRRESLRLQIGTYERELESAKVYSESERRHIENLARERDVLNKSLLKSAGHTQKQLNLVRLHDQSRKNLVNEIETNEAEAQRQRKIIYNLEKERDRYITEASDLTFKVLQYMEDIKAREIQLFELRKKIAESETKLRQQINLYEAVECDRNLYSKNLIESQDELTEMKRRLKVLFHQLDQVKEMIHVKDRTLIREHLARRKVEKEKSKLNMELQKLKSLAIENKLYLESQDVEATHLKIVIQKATKNRRDMRKQIHTVIRHRDNLICSILDRNKNLSVMFDKIKISAATITNRETDYVIKVVEAQKLKSEVKKSKYKKLVLLKSVNKSRHLRIECNWLQRELLQEQNKCRILEEEIKKPVNIHRWRKMEGDDPIRYQMIINIRALQKRLIAKNEEMQHVDFVINSQEKLFMEVIQMLARQPGPEAAEQLQLYEQILVDKRKQLVQMNVQFRKYSQLIEDYQGDVRSVQQDIRDIRQAYIEERKKANK